SAGAVTTMALTTAQPSGEPAHLRGPPQCLEGQEYGRPNQDGSGDPDPRPQRPAQPMRDSVRHEPCRPGHDGRARDDLAKRGCEPLRPTWAEVAPHLSGQVECGGGNRQ